MLYWNIHATHGMQHKLLLVSISNVCLNIISSNIASCWGLLSINFQCCRPYLQDLSGNWGSRGGRRIKNAAGLIHIMSSKFHGYSRKCIMHHVQNQRPLKKCTYSGIDVVVCTWNISFVLDRETFSLLSTEHILLYLPYFILPTMFCSIYHILFYLPYFALPTIFCSTFHILFYLPYFALPTIFCSTFHILFYLPYFALPTIFCSTFHILFYLPYFALPTIFCSTFCSIWILSFHL